jgi:hypothetical protein
VVFKDFFAQADNTGSEKAAVGVQRTVLGGFVSLRRLLGAALFLELVGGGAQVLSFSWE